MLAICRKSLMAVSVRWSRQSGHCRRRILVLTWYLYLYCYSGRQGGARVYLTGSINVRRQTKYEHNRTGLLGMKPRWIHSLTIPADGYILTDKNMSLLRRSQLVNLLTLWCENVSGIQLTVKAGVRINLLALCLLLAPVSRGLQIEAVEMYYYLMYSTV